eukprot:GHVS01082624.1.p1 GENE.GHVS01082624.1~~GHVS01082624.1.p1  ORF type:complete len:294 (+),score=44.13 GHVS01082624.1:220-1101(+)
MSSCFSPCPDISFVCSLARTAGDIILPRFDSKCKEQTYLEKFSSNDLVTQTDVKVEELLKKELAMKYPTHKFLCEESADVDERLTDQPTWVIDPIDGTTNFIHGFPFCCVSIAFVENKQPKLGVVFIPATNEMFSSELGKGSTCNGRHLYVSSRTSISECLVSIGFAMTFYQKLQQPNLTEAEKIKYAHIVDCSRIIRDRLVSSCRDIRRTGSCAIDLCFVAAGRMDAFIEQGPKEWDVAAGSLIVKEAGGCVTDWDGKEDYDWHNHRVLATSSVQLKNVFVDMLSDIKLYNN